MPAYNPGAYIQSLSMELTLIRYWEVKWCRGDFTYLHMMLQPDWTVNAQTLGGVEA